MPKLQKSKDKKAALLKATLSLVNTEGIQGASMAKVAKIAKVSPATIYLYFENKQDLVDELYLKVKENFSIHAFEDFNEAASIKDSFYKIWHNTVAYKLNHPEEASFLAQCDNTPMLSDNARQNGLKQLDTLLTLWEKGQSENILKNVSPYLMYAFTFYAMAFIMNKDNQKKCMLDKKNLEAAFEMAWDSIKINTK
ncbi:TetR/AcrR family transcriptional regulator [Putridiphycobacter roseus]|uniref:TetR/AcrR family transcriptional regulator n=1 Tax=Putridiphycobacter roseus TaxID=2219161 RepID=A0A2W1MZZ8_9FLAO|nr:TetR/AcrR family transcriptional regulator [Putridiphycobacter roseus]PZE16860.1 TetR/AcrR family transcriptional regulator [Putridiphycobacter roseus]